MPTQLEFRTEGVFIWNYGVVTAGEMLASNRAIYNHEFVGDFVYQIAMNSRVEELTAEPSDMRKLAEMDREFVGQSPQIGIVVAESDYVFGMCRMWNQQAETETFDAAVVRRIDDARKLLEERGVDPGSFDYPDLPDEPNNATVFYDHALSSSSYQGAFGPPASADDLDYDGLNGLITDALEGGDMRFEIGETVLPFAAEGLFNRFPCQIIFPRYYNRRDSLPERRSVWQNKFSWYDAS